MISKLLLATRDILWLPLSSFGAQSELLKAIFLAVPKARLAGVDMSPEMLAVARAKSRGDLDLREGHAEALPFENEACDVVVSSSAFHFFRRPTAALVEMHRVLRPSGSIVITDWCSDYPACFLYDLFLRLFSPAHFRTYSSKKLHQLLNEAKFSEVTVRRYKIDRGWGMMTATAKKMTTAMSAPRADQDCSGVPI